MKQDSWDYDRFIKYYNEIARENGGWVYDNELTPEELKDRYYFSSAKTLKEFARDKFIYDQRH